MPFMCNKCCKSILGYTLDYETVKLVRVRNWKVGFLNRFVQIAVIAYIIGYVIVYRKGYQDTGNGQSSVVTKVKGIGNTMRRKELDPIYRQIWDQADYVVPPQENGAFFVLTNAIITPRQQQGVCPEDPYIGEDALCGDGSHKCTKGRPVPNGNGIMTGKCVQSNVNTTLKTCEVEAWCPVEVDKLNSTAALLPEAENFTVLIKNFISFPKFGKGYKLRNIIKTVNNSSYLRSCEYHEENDPFCPVFRLGYIVKEATADFHTLATKGGIISITVTWDCNLDFDIENCKPEYDFNRLDSEDTKIAPGWNFRFSKNYRDVNNTATRDLYKAYGIRFVFTVNGKAGKFSVIPLFLNIGSGLALLAVSTILCDLMLLYCLKRRNYYVDNKYLSLENETDFLRSTNEDSTEDV